MTISQSKNNKLTKQAEEMVQVIANDVLSGNCGIGYKAIRGKYKVGTATAKKARELVRELGGDKFCTINSKPGPKPKRNKQQSDLLMKGCEMLRLSNGENLLTRAWL